MKYYAKLLTMGCFSREQVCDLTENYNTSGTFFRTYPVALEIFASKIVALTSRTAARDL